MKKFEPLFDAVIVQPLEEEQNQSSIIIPDLGKEKNEIGEVIAVGPGKYTIMGTFIHTVLNVGDVVILPTMGFTKFELEGKDYYIGPENNVLSKINKE